MGTLSALVRGVFDEDAVHASNDDLGVPQYCRVPDCDEVAARGDLCALHLKRQQRGKSLTDPVEEKLTPKQRLIDMALELRDYDDDDNALGYYAKERAFLRAADAYGLRSIAEKIRAGLAGRRAQGKPLGRPLRVTPQKAKELVEKSGGVRAAAARSGISRRTLQRQLRRLFSGVKNQVSDAGSTRPRSRG